MTGIDERIVAMHFDNKNFEKNAKQTIETLEDLRDHLDMEGAAKGFSELAEKTKELNFSDTSKKADGFKKALSGIQTVAKKTFSAATFPLKSLSNQINGLISDVQRWIGIDLAHSIEQAGKQFVKALTIDPLSTGWNEYEMKMDSIKSIMSGTASTISKLGIDPDSTEHLEYVKAELEELNHYADQTIYSFQDMTSNIGKFTNAGVSLDRAVPAMKGIANLAASAGQGAQQASMAMYNFSQSMSMGYVELRDWRSIENANMATLEFKQTLIDVGLAMKTLKRDSKGVVKTAVKGSKKVEVNAKNVRETLKQKWLTDQVLTTALEVYSGEFKTAQEIIDAGLVAKEEIVNGRKVKKSDEQLFAEAEALLKIGNKAQQAATEVRTFTKMYDALKESAQSGWGETWELIFGDMHEATTLWTEINNAIDSLIQRAKEARNNALLFWRGGQTLYKKDEFGNIISTEEIGIQNTEDSFLDMRDVLIESIREIVFNVGQLVTAFNQAKEHVFGKFDLGRMLVEWTKSLADFASNMTAWLLIADENGVTRLDRIQMIMVGLLSILKAVGRIIKKVVGIVKRAVMPLIDPIIDFLSTLGAAFDQLINNENFEGFATYFIGAFVVAWEHIKNGVIIQFTKVKRWFVGLLAQFFNIKTKTNPDENLEGWFSEVFTGIGKAIKSKWEEIVGTVREWLNEKWTGLVNAILGTEFMQGILNSKEYAEFTKTVQTVFSAIRRFFVGDEYVDVVADADKPWKKKVVKTGSKSGISQIFESIKTTITDVYKDFTGWIDEFKQSDIYKNLEKTISGIFNALEIFFMGEEHTEVLIDADKPWKKTVRKVRSKSGLSQFVESIQKVVTDIYNSLFGWIEEFKKSDTYKNISEGLTTLFSGIQNFFMDHKEATAWDENGKPIMWANRKAGIVTTIEEIKTFVNGIVESVNKFFSIEKGTPLGDALTTVTGWITEVTAKYNEIKDTVTTFINNLFNPNTEEAEGETKDTNDPEKAPIVAWLEDKIKIVTSIGSKIAEFFVIPEGGVLKAGIDAVNAWFKSVTDGIAEVSKIVTDYISNLFGGTASAEGETTVESSESEQVEQQLVDRWVEELYNNAGGIVRLLIDTLIAWFGDPTKSVVENVDMLQQTVSSWISGTIQTIREAIETAKTSIQTFFFGADTESETGEMVHTNSVFENIAKWFSDTWASVETTIEPYWTPIKNFFTPPEGEESPIAQFFGWINKGVTEAQSTFETTWSSVTSFFTNMTGFFFDQKVETAWDADGKPIMWAVRKAGIGTIFEGIETTITDLYNEFFGWIEEFKQSDVYKSISSAVSSIFSELGKFFIGKEHSELVVDAEKPWKKKSRVVSAMPSTISEFFDSIKKTVANVYSEFFGWIDEFKNSKIYKDLSESLPTIFTAIQDFFVDRKEATAWDSDGKPIMWAIHKSGISTIIDNVKQSVTELYSEFFGWIDEFKKSKIYTDVSEGLATLFSGIYDFFVDHREVVAVDEEGNPTAWIERQAGIVTMIEEIGKVVDSVVGSINEFFSFEEGTPLGDAFNRVKGWIDTISPIYEEVKKAIVDFVTSLFAPVDSENKVEGEETSTEQTEPPIVTWLRDKVQAVVGIKDQIVQFAENLDLGTKFTNAWNTIRGFFAGYNEETAWDSDGNPIMWAKHDGIWTTLTSWFSSLSTDIDKFKTNVVEWTGWQAIKEFFTGKDGEKGQFVQFFESIGTGLNTAWETLKGSAAWEMISGFFKQSWQTLVDFFTKENPNKDNKTGFGQTVDFLKDKFRELGEFFETNEFGKSVKQFFTDLWGSISGFFTEVNTETGKTPFISIISNLMTKILDFANNLTNVTSFSDLINNFNNFWASLFGLNVSAEGAKEGEGALEDAAKPTGTVGQAINFVEQIRLLAEAIKNNVPEGLWDAMSRFVKAIGTFFTDLLNGAADWFGEGHKETGEAISNFVTTGIVPMIQALTSLVTALASAVTNVIGSKGERWWTVLIWFFILAIKDTITASKYAHKAEMYSSAARLGSTLTVISLMILGIGMLVEGVNGLVNYIGKDATIEEAVARFGVIIGILSLLAGFIWLIGRIIVGISEDASAVINGDRNTVNVYTRHEKKFWENWVSQIINWAGIFFVLKYAVPDIIASMTALKDIPAGLMLEFAKAFAIIVLTVTAVTLAVSKFQKSGGGMDVGAVAKALLYVVGIFVVLAALGTLLNADLTVFTNTNYITKTSTGSNIKSIGDAIISFFEWIGRIGGAITGGFKYQETVSAANGAKAAVDALDGLNLTEDAKTNILGMLDFFGEMLSRIPSKATNFGEFILNIFGQGKLSPQDLKDYLTALGSGLRSFVDAIDGDWLRGEKGKMEHVGGIDPQDARNFADALSSLFQAFFLFTQIDTGLIRSGGTAEAFVDWLKELGTAGNTLDQESLDGVSTFFGSFGGAVQKGLDDAATGLNTNAISQAIITSIQNDKESIAKAVQEAYQQAGTTIFGENGNSDPLGLGNLTQVTSTMSEFMNQFNFSGVMGEGSTIIGQMFGGLNPSELEGGITKLLGGEDGTSGLYGILQQKVEGMNFDQILSGELLPETEDLDIEAFITDMTGELTSEINLSKFMDVGYTWDMTLMRGLIKYKNVVAIAGDRIRDDLISALMPVETYLSNSAITNPVITPVLDLTAVNEQAAQLNGLLNGDLVANPMGKTLVVEINKDRNEYAQFTQQVTRRLDELNSRISSLGVYLNTGVLVGQLAPGIDKYIGGVATLNYRSRL